MICEGDLKTKEIKTLHIKNEMILEAYSYRREEIREGSLLNSTSPQIGWVSKVSKPVPCKALCWVGYRDWNRDV